MDCDAAMHIDIPRQWSLARTALTAAGCASVGLGVLTVATTWSVLPLAIVLAGVLVLVSSSSATPFTEAGLVIGGTIALQASLLQTPHTDRVSFPSVHGAFVFIGCAYIGLGLLSIRLYRSRFRPYFFDSSAPR
ncbi:hypothetical protein RN2511_038010 [Rhodococcus sp. NKCM2511]|uniref:hypothetical protein n=1 Tax=Rhodococcus sp. NKCM2511 TaxID=2766011 RepID=UPI00191078C5|nr:hypothetical protein [Rhodococcus sp. NKCM2511]GHP19065.1 hypothetical protein RN2511_038010 [Rhodococcus sp. NKCM2511]